MSNLFGMKKQPNEQYVTMVYHAGMKTSMALDECEIVRVPLRVLNDPEDDVDNYIDAILEEERIDIAQTAGNEGEGL